MDSKKFNVGIVGPELNVELYTDEFIERDLTSIFGEDSVKSYSIEGRRKWQQIREDNKAGTKYFTYIKFFKEKDSDTMYGIIGGKTNYNHPDISFDEMIDGDRRIGRIFLSKGKYEQCNKVIVIHHSVVGDQDSMRAILLEKYVQRRYHLFDS